MWYENKMLSLHQKQSYKFRIKMNIPIESLNFQMLNVGLAKHDADWNWQNVVSPFTRIYLVTEGCAKLYLPNRVVDLQSGHMYIVPAHTVHSYECAGKFSHYYLHFYEGFKKETDIFDFYDFPVEIDSNVLDEAIFDNMCKHHPEAQLPASDPTAYDNMGKFIDYVHRYNELSLAEKMELRGSILILFSKFVHKAQAKVWTQDKRLAKVLTHIHNNIYEEISIDDLAAMVCVTKSHFIRIFVKMIGMSPLQYINRKKIDKAELLLITDDQPIKEIAYDLGYNDHSYFIRLFKKITGITPMAYRKNMR